MTKPLTEIRIILVLFTSFWFSARPSTASSQDQRYNIGDPVPMFVNKVGPLNNPSETYQYYDLPFCHPGLVIQKMATLGEVLNGDRLSNTLYEMKFREEKGWETLCIKKLKADDVAKFRNAINNDFYFQMYYDDLPLWGFVGKIEEKGWNLGKEGPRYYLFTHVQFDALYNGDRVIEISAFSDPNHAIDITEDIEINVKFTYSVIWNATSARFENRMNKFSRHSLVPISRKIHWFSLLNAIAIIVILICLLTLLFLKRLKNDLKKYSSVDGEDEREVGWKFIHGDVFRTPPNLSLFCAVLGTGTQLLTLTFVVFVLAFLGVIYPYNRGALFTSIVAIYPITSLIAGYTAASFHCQFTGTGWERSVFLTGNLYFGPLVVAWSFLNTLAISYGATSAFPFGTIVVIFIINTLVNIPLLGLGGVIGHRFRSEFQAPSATKKIPRDIPPSPWYRRLPCQMFIAGLLCFSAIVLELHHLYASMWGFKIFTFPSLLFIMFIVLVILTALVSIGLTYIQLSVEDHQWWWRSVFSGGSTAIFMFSYSIYFYAQSNMNSFLQLCFFMGYNACMIFAFFLMLGTISFYASFMFVRHIYHAVKSE